MSHPKHAPLALAVLTAVLVVAVPSARAQATLPAGFSDQLVVGSLDQPVGMAALPDGRLLVIEQKSARIRVIAAGALLSPAAGTVDQVRTAGNEQGLLGIAVDPAWPAKPYVYVHCDDATGLRIRVSRYALTGDLAYTGTGALTLDLASRFDLITDVPDNASNHNGGTLRFGLDGMLYASFGEDADPCGAQDSTALKGCILRLAVSGLPAGPGVATRAQITPADNPFVSSPNLNRRLLWAKGLRNPFRFTIDSATGALVIGDVGQSAFEEIDRSTTGGVNHGWPLFEGNATYTTCSTSLPSPVPPIAVLDRQALGGASIIAGPTYHAPPGATAPFPAAFDGDIFYSEYYSGMLRRLKWNGTSWDLVAGVNASDWGTGMVAVSDYLVGSDGALWYCRQSIGFAANTGQIRRIVVDSVTGVPPTPRFGLELAPPFPSPARGPVTLRYRLGAPARVDLRVLDASGRLVRALVAGELRGAPGEDLTWDTRDERGARVPAGLYLVRLEVGGEVHMRRLPLVR
jgi:glucose/arabinose dehydrogenase